MIVPTLYLTNAASRRPPYRGPGRVFSIMAAPRAHYGERGEGVVPALVPPLDWVRAAKAGTLPMGEYRERYVALLAERAALLSFPHLQHEHGGSLFDGDSLLCACSKAAAADGRCHRCWAAAALLRAGWAVVLDGRPLTEAP